MLFSNALLISATSLASLVFPTVLGAPSVDVGAGFSAPQMAILKQTTTWVTQMNSLANVTTIATNGTTNQVARAVHAFRKKCGPPNGVLSGNGGGGGSSGDILSGVLGGLGGTLGGLLAPSGGGSCLGGPIGSLLDLGNLSNLLSLGPDGLLGEILSGLGLGYLLDPTSTASLINNVLIALLGSLNAGGCSDAQATEILTLINQILNSCILILNSTSECKCGGGTAMTSALNGILRPLQQ
ncbi:hypothetical protein C8R46DRAFT_1201797 [Mycena filopes]|nr:hypothetical protein C8R46DRAFT_1201797 [Mycena filopes]